ncbi:hypothetical protein IWX90DRAFT_138668 [Phyllosticta citrichinensis]|uniref:Autophagy-related protein 2 n=1 Tax=Phyllosticta citrichinensis TaxID=1130410 RepID=A0ABR1XYJ8_9PEZI
MAFAFNILSASIKSRLLRYALSRIEFLDDDALDLGRLDLTWGKKNVLALRDVGLNVAKLTSLLSLPPGLTLIKASVRDLRITVPADLSTGICIEIDGVIVKTKVVQDLHDNDKTSGKGQPRAKSGPSGEAIPTTEDLAKSFLLEEPPEEKRELEAAIGAQSQYQQESTAEASILSDDSAEASELGTGVGLSLPSVVTNFLDGVRDKLQVSIKNVELHLDMEVPPDGWDNDDAVGPATAVFHIGRVDLEGLTVTSSTVGQDNVEDTRGNKRKLTLETLCAGILLDERVMSKSRVTVSSPESPAAARSVRPEFSSTLSQDSSFHSSASVSGFHNARTSTASMADDSVPVNKRSQMMESSFSTDDGKFADADEGSSGSQDISQMEQSTVFGMDLSQPSGEDEQSHEQEFGISSSNIRPGDEEQHFDSEQALSLGHVPDDSSSSPSQSSPDLRSGSSQPVYSTSSPKSYLSPTGEHDDLSGNAESYHSTTNSPNFSQSTHEELSPTSSGASNVNDLEQSRLFTHEDTESLYMSVMGDELDESERDFKMPGGWDSASTTSSERGPDRARSTTSGRMKRDNPGTIRENEEGLDTPRVQSPVDRARPGRSAGEEGTDAGDDFPDATRIYYPLFDVDTIVVWLPQPGSSPEDTDPPDSPQPARASKVSFEEASVFGSFSQYAASTSRSRVGRPSVQNESAPRDPGAEHFAQNPSPNHGIEVEVGKVRAQMDVDFIYLAMSILKSLQDWPAGPDSGQECNTRRAARTDHKFALKVSISDIQIALLNQLSSHGVEPMPFVGPLQHPPWNSGDVLLKTKISKTTVSVIGKRETLEVKGKTGTLRLGFNDSDILSFSPASSLDETTVGLDPAQESEISWNYVKNNARSEIHISALPMHTALDVQKLDETFAAHGGLSGVLRIGKNIKSTCSLPSSPPRKKPTAGAAGELSPTPMKMPKVNIVLGGFDFVLQGESCAALLETSRVKIAARDQLFGISVRHARVSGPHPTHRLWAEDVPVQATLDDVDIRYNFTPAEADLSKLLALITPSKYKYEADDDILIDTLMAQRRKGSLIKINARRGVQLEISDLGGLERLKQLGNDVAKLSSVAKLLPDDERPGLLSIIEAAECGVAINVNDKIGRMSVIGRRLQIAHVGLPSLVAVAVGSLESQRGEQQTLVDQVSTPHAHDADIPSLMVRLLGDEMEPTVKVKLFNVLIDYHVDLLMAILGLTEPNEIEEAARGPHDSVATIKRPNSPDNATKQSSASSERYGSATQPMNLDIQLSDCAVGLNPRNSSAKALLVLTDARVSGALLKDVATTVKADIRKASLLIIDDVSRLARDDLSNVVPRSAELGSRQVVELCRLGFVSVGTTSKAKATIKITEPDAETKQVVDVEFNNDLFVMETCADSTQTLIAIFGGLAPPQPISQAIQYRTKVEPVFNMMASLAGETLGPEQQGEMIDMDQSVIVDDDEQNLHFMGSFYDPDQLPSLDQMTEESVGESRLNANLADALSGREDSGEDLELNFQEDFFGAPSAKRNVAQAWNSRKNEYVESSDVMEVESPLTLHIHDVHFIWNLYDGYDWPETRERLGQKLEEVQQRAQDRRDRRYGVDEDDGVTIEEDLLFGSIYIALPIYQTPQENARQINRAMKGGDDTVSETSYATTTATGTSSRPGSKKVRLKLERGRHHKITFELKGIAADFVAFPPGASETQTSIDVRVRDLDVIDHVPTSTWRKFMTYDRDAGERPLDLPFLKLEVLNVRPVLDLAATELVIRVSVLPVRLHVDQDALDFITRFFEFKDDRASHVPPSQAEQPFIQRLEVKTVKLKLDYKPKQVDYAGLRSGHTTEFMNFVILDGANIVLRRCIVYGISGFDKVHKTLNDIWMPDVKRNQIPSILAGLATVRPIANVGSGFRNFVTVPMSEYRKDGRLVRAVQKGAVAAAKTTGIELLRLGAKVSIGTQAVIQGAEGLLSPTSKSAAGGNPSHHHGETDWEDLSPNGSPSGAGGAIAPEPRAFSNYADQPIGVRAGLISARRHLQADFALARDAIIAIPGEIMESGSASGAAWVIARNAPVLVVRPLAAAAKASGAALFGAANAMDRESARRIDEKYKRQH